jgi:hypothetical protein
MLREVLRLLGTDLDQKIAEIRAPVDEFRVRTTRQVPEQVKDTGLTVSYALAGTIAATATVAIVVVVLYRWVDMRSGPFVALAATGVVMASLAGAVMASLAVSMFVLAFGRDGRRPASPTVVHRQVASPPPLLSPPIPVSASAALAPLPANASALDVLTHRFSTRAAGASDVAVNAAVDTMRTGAKPALFGTLAVVGVILGRSR